MSHPVASPRSPRPPRLLAAALLAAAAGCTAGDPGLGATDRPVVYGVDDRQDVYAFADQTWAARALEVSAAMVDTSQINASNPDNITLSAGTLGNDYDLCSGERFTDQQTAAGCSATLIAPDLVLTAGHCISASQCGGTSYVFDYAMTDATTRHTITADDVYACDAVVVRQVADADYAVVRLDREVVGRTPATVAVDGAALTNGTPLVVQGYPSGIPLKIDDGGAVRDGHPAETQFFVANLDTFGGNSGSGVFKDDGTLVGILVRGETDYVADGSCNRVNVCAEDSCRGEDSTYAFRAIAALCDVTSAPGLCTCGDATCDAAEGETTVTCPLDCGTSCGDGACNGDESPLNCTDDCGFCGNGACDNGETEGTCCLDCACTGTDQVCLDNACVLDPSIGDACDTAFDLEPTGTQTITDSTTIASDDLAGSCAGNGAPDRVYAFTLDRQTAIDATLTGYDTALHLRSACDDAGTELACNDDSDPPGDFGSRLEQVLEPGSYALIVDGFGDNSGSYQLTVVFTPMGPVDECPDDPTKTEAGACGCGVPDDDGDADGVPDCDDACPDDAADACDDPGVEPGEEDGGCCSTSGGDPRGAALLVVAVALAVRRRRRRR